MKKKDYTLYIYAVGRNELEPEIWRQIEKLFNIIDKRKLSKKINLFLEVGRAEKKLLKIIRKRESFEEINSCSGVKRYFLDENKIKIYEKKRSSNMASPRNLQNFLEVGLNKFPAKNNILILSGHSYQFVGMMTDYCQDRPYIMGYPELSEIINRTCKKLMLPLDVIILDSCYCNYIEIIYEFNYYEREFIKNIAVFDKSPLQGFSYVDLVNILAQNKEVSLKKLIEKMIKKNNEELKVYKINKNIFKKIKSIFNKLAEIYLSEGRDKKENIKNYIQNIQRTEENNKLIEKLYYFLRKISYNNEILLNIAYKLPEDIEKINLYSKLKFSWQNKWFEIIAGDYKNKINFQEKERDLLPLILSKDALKENIKSMNPGINEIEIEKIYSKLIEYRKWDLKE
ncbi:MAG: clostripain-related cysteine peptidase [Bacillota bacterium]